MKTTSIILVASALLLGMMSSCKKSNSSSNETTHTSTPPFQVGQSIAPGNLAKNSYKGTMTTGNTYNLTGDFTINAGDTVYLQPGVTVCVSPGVTIIVKGVLISMGTQASPNTFTCCGTTQIDQIGNSDLSDPAYAGKWTGINCDTSCKLLELQWTHVNFTGGTFTSTEPFVGGSSGTVSFSILFQNPNGDLIITDSWIYGCTDDCVRIQQGRLYIARNTVEKMGYLGGDGLNAKHGSQGDMAFNLCVGNATNSTKCSDKGSGAFVQCNINMYNNTYVDCGYRQSSFQSRGSDIDYEQGGRGWCYNNLIVNCRNGIRIGNGQNAIPMPDTTNTLTGYNWIYADSIQEVNQFYPIQAGTWTRDITIGTFPGAYIEPTPAQLGLGPNFYSPNNPVNGGDDASYSAPLSVATANNPLFVNFPLPEHLGTNNLSAIASVETGVNDPAAGNKNYDFHLQSGSPCRGKGTASFSAFANIINKVTTDVTNPNFAPTISQPSADMGCYPFSGGGNLH